MSNALHALLGAGGFGREVMPLARAEPAPRIAAGNSDPTFVVEGENPGSSISDVPVLSMQAFRAWFGERGFAACRGEYIAVLEGDDYWTFPGKLRRQIAFLESQRACVACATNYVVHDEERCSFQLRVPINNSHSFVDARHIRHMNLPGNFSTIMYRRTALQALPKGLFALRAYDWMLNICLAWFGPIGMLHRPMSVYRVHADGAWSRLSEAEKIRQQIIEIEAYDAFTDRVFHDDFQALRKSLEQRHLAMTRLRWRNPAHVKP